MTERRVKFSEPKLGFGVFVLILCTQTTDRTLASIEQTLETSRIYIQLKVRRLQVRHKFLRFKEMPTTLHQPPWYPTLNHDLGSQQLPANPDTQTC